MLLENGWEPVKVLEDRNCLFQSISMLLTGEEDHHKLIKLAVIAHGCANGKYYLKNVNIQYNIIQYNIIQYNITHREVVCETLNIDN